MIREVNEILDDIKQQLQQLKTARNTTRLLLKQARLKKRA
jgi:hypothetical protein